MNTNKEPQKIQGILLHRHDGNSDETDGMRGQMHKCCALRPQKQNHAFPAGSDPGAESNPDTQVHRSTSLFSQVLPLLFIHEAEREEGRDLEREGNGEERNPPLVRPLMWKTKSPF